MPVTIANQVRCAVYTRKSTAFGLNQEVNSLRVQREVCEAYVRCQQHRNWTLNDKKYDDGAQSGGNLDRPALQELINDIETDWWTSW